MAKRIEYKTGDKVGEMTYICELPKTPGSRRRRAKFLCSCGNEKEAMIQAVKFGRIVSCGCKFKGKPAINRVHHKPGERMGDVIFLRELPKVKQKVRRGEFLCKCGNVFVSDIKNIRGGNKNSCGCLVKGHGFTAGNKIPTEYRIWAGLKSRCYSVNNPGYHNYGGRGIKVCDRWLESFENFLEDMGERPSKKYSIDRIDNDGDYCPENCRWATRVEQSRNTRRNVIIKHNGKEQCLEDWAKEVGVNSTVIKNRIKKGATIEEALVKC